MKQIVKCLILIFCILGFQGCLESNSIPVFDFTGESSSEMVTYLETHGDVINTVEVPWLVDAQTVNDSLKDFLLIDTRPAYIYMQGHIEGAKNIQSNELLSFMTNTDVSRYPKIVIISANGQASAYYAALLRLAGYEKIYSMNFGMASWNKDFAKLWLNSCKNSVEMKQYTNAITPMNRAANLPRIEFRTKSDNVKDKIQERISDLLSAGFNDYDSLITDNQSPLGPSVDSWRITDASDAGPYYLVCYGNDDLYIAMGLTNPYSGFGHPKGAVQYSPASSLRGREYLMTFPGNMEIIVYSFNGQLSAAVTAYLRMLGFNARSMLFGANTLFYYRLLYYTPSRLRDTFKQSDIKDFPYVTGN